MRPLVAHYHLGLGMLYRRTGKREEARNHLTTATTMYREMDMRFWLEQAEAEFGERSRSSGAQRSGVMEGRGQGPEPSGEREKRFLVVPLEGEQIGLVVSEDPLDLDRRAVPPADPHDLRRRPEHEASLMEIGILGDDDEPVLCSVGPDRVIVSGL